MAYALLVLFMVAVMALAIWGPQKSADGNGAKTQKRPTKLDVNADLLFVKRFGLLYKHYNKTSTGGPGEPMYVPNTLETVINREYPYLTRTEKEDLHVAVAKIVDDFEQIEDSRRAQAQFLNDSQNPLRQEQW